MWSLNRQLQCKSVKIYRAQTPENLALTKILLNFSKTSTPSWKLAHPAGENPGSATAFLLLQIRQSDCVNLHICAQSDNYSDII